MFCLKHYNKLALNVYEWGWIRIRFYKITEYNSFNNTFHLEK